MVGGKCGAGDNAEPAWLYTKLGEREAHRDVILLLQGHPQRFWANGRCPVVFVAFVGIAIKANRGAKFLATPRVEDAAR
jgi:hypothetical protein